VKIAQGIRGVCIPIFGKISIKILVLGFLCPYSYTDIGEIWHGGRSGTSVHCSVPNFTPIEQRVAHAGQKNLKIGL